MNRFQKSLTLLLIITISHFSAYSQLSKNWFNEDPSKDKFAGVSSDLAYEELLKKKKSTTVIVAIIDGGTDVSHPDLKEKIWVNADELPGNGIDDDNNGYVDDVNGWSFIGGKNGDVRQDTYEAVRVYNMYKPLYDGKNTSGLNDEQKKQYKQFTEAKKFIDTELAEAKKELAEYEKLKGQLDALKTALGSGDFKAEDVAMYQTQDTEFNKLKTGIASAMTSGVPFNEIYDDVVSGYDSYKTKVDFYLNTAFDPRTIVGDNYDNYSERFYGNNNVSGPDASHGTHVAGIVGADRDNDIGIKGVATDVQLMILQVVPDGDERDKDVANAIRYATDNGAKIINMSFGKDFSPGKKYVDEAVQYAASKDVLLVHGAGNDHSNIDKEANFPHPYYESTATREPAWLEVGAISSSGDIASFSNYGARKVDILAPGVKIYSTIPDSGYANFNGTSMAAPVVAGIAAMIRSYYPDMTAVMVRKVIMDSAIKMPIKTVLPGTKKKKVKYSKLCATGGIANAYRALKVAEAYSRK